MFQRQPLKKNGKPRALVVEDPKRYGFGKKNIWNAGGAGGVCERSGIIILIVLVIEVAEIVRRGL